MASYTPQQIEEFLQEFFDVAGTRQYIGARYVPLFGRKGEGTTDWDNSAPYEALTIVTYQGNSYTSCTYVPAGVDITDTRYWVQTGMYDAQVEQYRREVASVVAGLEGLSSSLASYEATNDARVETLTDTVESTYATLGDGLTTERAERFASDNALSSRIDVNSSRIDSLSNLPEGSTSLDAEVVDIRVPAFGGTYTSAGNAVRGQIGALNAITETLVGGLELAPSWEQGGYSISSANLPSPTTSDKRIRAHIDVSDVHAFHVEVETGYEFVFSFVTADDTQVKYATAWRTYKEFFVGSLVTDLYVAVRKLDAITSEELDITPNDGYSPCLHVYCDSINPDSTDIPDYRALPNASYLASFTGRELVERGVFALNNVFRGTLINNVPTQGNSPRLMTDYIDVSMCDSVIVQADSVTSKIYGYSHFNANKQFIRNTTSPDVTFTEGGIDTYILPTRGAAYMTIVFATKVTTDFYWDKIQQIRMSFRYNLPDDALPLNVVTQNVGRYWYGTGYGIPAESYNEKIVGWRRMFGGENADITLTQEDYDTIDAAHEISSLTALYAPLYRYRNVITSNWTKIYSNHRIIDSVTLTFTDNRRYTRSIVEVAGMYVYVYDIHLSPIDWNDVEASAAVRTVEMQELIAEIGAKRPCIIAGDTNVASIAELSTLKSAGIECGNTDFFGDFFTWSRNHPEDYYDYDNPVGPIYYFDNIMVYGDHLRIESVSPIIAYDEISTDHLGLRANVLIDGYGG